MINDEYVKKISDELLYFEDYVPIVILLELDVHKRVSFLREHELFDVLDKMSRQRLLYGQEGDKYAFLEKEVEEFIEKYPQYKELQQYKF